MTDLRFTMSNFEDWDFSGCLDDYGNDLDRDSSDYDWDADWFLTTHFANVIGIDALWVQLIAAMVERGVAGRRGGRGAHSLRSRTGNVAGPRFVPGLA